MDKAGIRYIVALSVAKQAVYRLTVQKQPMSFERLRNELLHVQSSQMVDRSTGRRCLVPSHVTVAVKEIYHAFGKALGSPAPSGLRAQPRRRGGVM